MSDAATATVRVVAPVSTLCLCSPAAYRGGVFSRGPTPAPAHAQVEYIPGLSRDPQQLIEDLHLSRAMSQVLPAQFQGETNLARIMFLTTSGRVIAYPAVRDAQLEPILRKFTSSPLMSLTLYVVDRLLKGQLRLNRQLREMGLVDGLTQLANRRHLQSDFGGLVQRLREDQPLALWMLDIDRFKNINDTWGVAELRADGCQELEDLVATADRRLYAAKKAGRNQVVSSE